MFSLSHFAGYYNLMDIYIDNCMVDQTKEQKVSVAYFSSQNCCWWTWLTNWAGNCILAYMA
jgi:hypothetical protein